MSDEKLEKLKKLLGPIGYVLARTLLDRAKIKFDPEQRKIHITRDGKTHVFGFDEIERVLSDFSQ